MEDSRSVANHGILSHLDKIFPFLYIEPAKVTLLEEKFEKAKPLDVFWEFWCIDERRLAGFLDLDTSMVSFLLKYHRMYDEEGKHWVVNPLDILSTIALFMKGSWKDRMTFFFRWYNVSGTKLLEEEEHFLLIRGIARCLRKLKLIGALDVSDADAHHLALEARIMYDEDNIPHLRPGLLLDDLVDWLMQSKFCKILLDFYAILHRLVDMLKTLDSRSASLLHIMEQKTENRQEDLPMEQFIPLKGGNRQTQISITNISSDRVSILVPTSLLLNHEGPFKVPLLYAIVERRIYLEDDEHYKIEDPIIFRKQSLQDARHAPNLHCCNKYFVESNMRHLQHHFAVLFPTGKQDSKKQSQSAAKKRQEIRRDFSKLNYNEYMRLRGTDISQGLHRYELDGLSSETEYNITFYTKHIQWGKIEVKTSFDDSFTASKIKSSSLPEQKEYHLCILPSSVNRASAIKANLHMVVPNVDVEHVRTTVVMTGSLLTVADQFQNYLFPHLESRRLIDQKLFRDDIAAILNHLEATCIQEWKSYGFDSVKSAFSLFQTPIEQLGDVPLLHQTGERSLVSFNGDGPFASSHYCANPNRRSLKRGYWRRWLYQLAGQVHPLLANLVSEKLERLYTARIASQVSPVRGIVSPVPGMTMCMTAHPSSVYYDQLTHCPLGHIAHLIQERHLYDALYHVRGTGTTNGAEENRSIAHRYVLLIRDPSDLLIDGTDKNARKSMAPTQNMKETNIVEPSINSIDDSVIEKEVQQQRLFGKYELVHGEYGKSKDSNKIGNLDVDANAVPAKKKSSTVESTQPTKERISSSAAVAEPESLTDFLQISLEYLRSNSQKSSKVSFDAPETVTAVTIVCCNWLGGNNMRIVYRPPPKQHVSKQNYSAPGYEPKSQENSQDTQEEEIVVLNIVNLAACESYLEPADAHFRNATLLSNHPLLLKQQRDALSQSATSRIDVDRNNEDGDMDGAGTKAFSADMINWNEQLLAAWRSRLPPYCSLEIDDDTDTRTFHVHPSYQSSDKNKSENDATTATSVDYEITFHNCWKEDEIDQNDEDNDIVAELWHGSLGWDSSLSTEKHDMLVWATAGTSEATTTPIRSLTNSQHSSFAAGSGGNSSSSLLHKRKGVGAVDRKKVDKKSNRGSNNSSVTSSIYHRWDIPTFLLSQGCNALPRRVCRLVSSSIKQVPFTQMTMYRPLYPCVHIGVAVHHFHATSIDQHHVAVSVSATGWGRLQCGIIAFPMNIQYEDALHLLHIAPKTLLQRVHSIQGLWIHHMGSASSASKINFTFDELKAGTKYAVFLWYPPTNTMHVHGHSVGNPTFAETISAAAINGNSTNNTKEVRSITNVVLVTTLAPASTQPLPRLSFMFAPFVADDFGDAFFVDYKTPRIRMLHQLLNQFRFAHPSVQALSVAPEEPAVENDSIKFSPEIAASKLLAPTWREFGLSQSTNVDNSRWESAIVDKTMHNDHDYLAAKHISTTFASNKASSQISGKQYLPIPGRSSGSGIFVQYYGPFCVLKMQNDTATCLLEAIKFLSSAELNFVPNHQAPSQQKSPLPSLIGFPEEEIRVLIVITARSFVHCFRVKTTDYAGRGIHYQHAEHGSLYEMETTVSFVRAMCDWQCQKVGRDVRVLTAGHVPDMLCIHLHRASIFPVHAFSMDDNVSQNDRSINDSGSVAQNSIGNESQQSQSHLLLGPDTAERHEKLDPFVIILYVFPTNLPPLSEEDELEDLEDENTAPGIITEVGTSEALNSQSQAQFTTDSLGNTIAVPNDGNSLASPSAPGTTIAGEMSLAATNDASRSSPTLDQHLQQVEGAPPVDLSPSKSVVSRKTMISVLTATSEFTGDNSSKEHNFMSPSSPDMSMKGIGGVNPTQFSLTGADGAASLASSTSGYQQASIDGSFSQTSLGNLSSKPMRKKSGRRKKNLEILPYWIFPAFGESHLLAEDIRYCVEIFAEAKSAKHFKPSHYQQQQQQLLQQLHQSQPDAAISSGLSVASMSSASLSLAGLGSNASHLQAASHFENYCSFHPAQHNWYMSRPPPAKDQQAPPLLTEGRIPSRMPYEPLPVFHLLDFVLPVLPEPIAAHATLPTSEQLILKNEKRVYRTYPLSLRGMKRDALFAGSGGACSTYLHHNSRVFHYPPKIRYLPPPLPGILPDGAVDNNALTVRQSMLDNGAEANKNASITAAAAVNQSTNRPHLLQQPSAITSSNSAVSSSSAHGPATAAPRCWMFAHQVATSLDLLRIVLGPIVGQVTRQSVRILFEFNMSITLPSIYRPQEGSENAASQLDITAKCIRCRLRYTVPAVKPTLDGTAADGPKSKRLESTSAHDLQHQDYVDIWVSGVEAYQPVVFAFQSLLPNVRYEILLPDLFPQRVLGVVQTLPLQSSAVELIFTADNCFVQVPVIDDFLRELGEIDSATALPDIQHFMDLNKYLYNFRGEDVIEFASFQEPYVYKTVPKGAATSSGVSGSTSSNSKDIGIEVGGKVPQPNMWHFLTEAIEAASTGSGIKSVFHLAPISPLAELEENLWQRFSSHLFARSEAILLSANNGHNTHHQESLDLLQQFQLQALEHLVRDSFRIVLSSPAVAAAFATCGHILLHHPKYLLPVDNSNAEPPASAPTTTTTSSASIRDRDRIIRRMFDHQVQLYVHSLFEGNMEQHDVQGVVGKASKDVFRDWRQSGVVVAMVDILSYRLKARKKAASSNNAAVDATNTQDMHNADSQSVDVKDEPLVIKQVVDGDPREDDASSDTTNQEKLASRRAAAMKEEDNDDEGSLSGNNPRSGFTLGFLDRKQWQRLRVYAGDNTILHLIIVLPQPLISLQAVRDASQAISEKEASLAHPDDNDEMIPWAPTNDDLQKFLQFWFDWMGKVKKESNGNETKSILIVSSAKIPFSTLIQDLRTGFKVYQLCVGQYDLHHELAGKNDEEKLQLAAEKLGVSTQEIVMTGKIGASYRYVHQFQGQDCYRTEPSGLISAATSSSDKNSSNYSNTNTNANTKLSSSPTAVPSSEEKDDHTTSDVLVVADIKGAKLVDKKGSGATTKKDKKKKGNRPLSPVPAVDTTAVVAHQRGGTGNVGFAKVKLYLDHWSPMAVWSNTNLMDLYNKAHNIGEAALIMGPLIGAPFVKRPITMVRKRNKSKASNKLSRKLALSQRLQASRKNRHNEKGDDGSAQEVKRAEEDEDGEDEDEDDNDDYEESTKVIDESQKQGNSDTTNSTTSEHDLPIYVPMVLEVDRISTIRIDIRGSFTHHHLVVEHVVPYAERPFVIEIGPLFRHDRYRIRFTSGIKVSSLGFNNSGSGHPKECIINTHYHRDESNFIVLNLASPGEDVSPAAVHFSDLRRRCAVPFHGLHSLVLTNFEPELTDTLRMFQQSPLLVQGIEEFHEMVDLHSYEKLQKSQTSASPLNNTNNTNNASGSKPKFGPIIPTLLRKELTRIMNTLRERYRENFSGPSLRDLLRMNMNILLPKLRYDPLQSHHLHHQGNSSTYQITAAVAANNNNESLSASIERLLHLLEAFVAQEYVDHFRFYDVNVYRVLLPVQSKPEAVMSSSSSGRHSFVSKEEEKVPLYGMWEEDSVQIEREDLFADYVAREIETLNEQLLVQQQTSSAISNVQYKLLWMQEAIGHAPAPQTQISPPGASSQGHDNHGDNVHQGQPSRPSSPSNPNSNNKRQSHSSGSGNSPHKNTAKGIRIGLLDNTTMNASDASQKKTPKTDVIEAIIVAWLAGCIPAPTVFIPYHALNRKASIERVRSLVKPLQVTLATRQFVRDTSVYRYHRPNSTVVDTKDELDHPAHYTPSVRLFVVADDDVIATETTLNYLEPSPAITESITPFLQKLHTWKLAFKQREYRIILPNVGPQGTKQLHSIWNYQPPAIPIPKQPEVVVVADPTNDDAESLATATATVVSKAPTVTLPPKVKQPLSYVVLDSIYRSNEYDRRHRIAEMEKKMHKKQLTAAAAKSKRAQQKKEEEERAHRQQIRQQVNDILAQQKPDGYLFIHCHTVAIMSPIEKSPAAFAPSDTDNNANNTNNGSVNAGDTAANNVDNNDSKPKEKGVVIIDTIGGSVSTAAPVSANPSSAAADGLMLLDEHDQIVPKQPEQQPYQRDDLTILQMEVCGDMLPLQLAYEAEVDAANKKKINPILEDNDENSVTIEPEPEKMSGPMYIDHLMNQRRYNYVQYPPWFIAYFPAHVSTATFVVDDVLLVLRQQARTLAVLQDIETSESLYAKFMHRYERSRLSELSRPEDLREVDMSSPEVVAVFFYDVIRVIWAEDLSKDMKSVMMSMQDPFVVGYIASRAFHTPSSSKDTNNNSSATNNNGLAVLNTGNQKVDQHNILPALTSAKSFAKGMVQMCVYAMAMKMARDMSGLRRYRHILDEAVDPALEKLKILETTEKMLDQVKRRRHAERAAEKKLSSLLRQLANSKAAKAAAVAAAADNKKSNAATDKKGVKVSTTATTATKKATDVAAAPVAAAVDDASIATMDTTAVAEKQAEEDAKDELLAAQLAEVVAIRAETVDYESDVEELIKEAERFEQQGGANSDDEDNNTTGGKVKMATKAQKRAQEEVDNMLSAEEKEAAKKKQNRPGTPTRRNNKNADDEDEKDMVEIDEATGQLDEAAMQALRQQRGLWEIESMEKGVEEVLEKLMEEAVESMAQTFFQDLVLRNMLPMTAAERSEWAALHMQRLAEERKVFRRVYGQRSNPLGV